MRPTIKSLAGLCQIQPSISWTVDDSSSQWSTVLTKHRRPALTWCWFDRPFKLRLFLKAGLFHVWIIFSKRSSLFEKFTLQMDFCIGITEVEKTCWSAERSCCHRQCGNHPWSQKAIFVEENYYTVIWSYDCSYFEINFKK